MIAYKQNIFFGKIFKMFCASDAYPVNNCKTRVSNNTYEEIHKSILSAGFASNYQSIVSLLFFSKK